MPNLNSNGYGLWDFDREPERRRVVSVAARALKQILIQEPSLEIMTANQTQFHFAHLNTFNNRLFVNLFTGRDNFLVAEKRGLSIPFLAGNLSDVRFSAFKRRIIECASNVDVCLPDFSLRFIDLAAKNLLLIPLTDR